MAKNAEPENLIIDLCGSSAEELIKMEIEESEVLDGILRVLFTSDSE